MATLEEGARVLAEQQAQQQAEQQQRVSPPKRKAEEDGGRQAVGQGAEENRLALRAQDRPAVNTRARRRKTQSDKDDGQMASSSTSEVAEALSDSGDDQQVRGSK
jgi:hypothetical protein